MLTHQIDHPFFSEIVLTNHSIPSCRPIISVILVKIYIPSLVTAEQA